MTLLRDMDLNQGPSGYEPDELPDCSIPRRFSLKPYSSEVALLSKSHSCLNKLRDMDLNQGPSGYEPDELPDCSIPRCFVFNLAFFRYEPASALLSTPSIYQHLHQLRNPTSRSILKGSLKLRKPMRSRCMVLGCVL